MNILFGKLRIWAACMAAQLPESMRCRSTNQKRLFTKRDRARLKLIVKGKRFGFSLEEIRQLLDLYDMGDQQQTQLVKTYELAKERLKQLELQHYELGETIKELKEQLNLGRELIKQANLSFEPAE